MKNKIRNAIAASVSAIALVCAAEAADRTSGLAASDNGVAIQWNIPAQPLSDALIAWSEQSNYAVLIRDDLAAGVQSQALIGSYTSFEALERLLAASMLTYKIRNETTLVVTPRLQPASLKIDGAENRLAASGQGTSTRAQRRASPPLEAERNEERDESGDSDEIVVTGTRIRGAPPASPQRTITRAEIDASGQSQIGEILRNIPQNFPGGSNRGVQPTPIADAAANQSNATTVNLRGLGPDATLVLVNGHRLASDSHWGGPDVSVIPVSAIKRIEIVTDGASALYGSDAVAGVANFVLRSDYSGTEASVRVGGATQGGGFEQNYNLMAGRSWGSGHALAGAEYLDQNAIGVSERDYTSTALPGNRLLPPQERASGFFTGRQEITDALRFELTALYSDRNAEYASEVALTGQTVTLIGRTDVDVASHLVAPRLDLDLGGDWTATLDGVHSANNNKTAVSTSFGSARESGIRNANSSVEINAQGGLFALPAGELRLATGGGYRRESQTYEAGSAALDRAAAREIYYAFAETLIPVIGASADAAGFPELDISAAARFEDYSDFGSTVNPRIGVRLQATPDLVLRGTWGKSFKAPLFRQLHSPVQTVLFPASAMGAPGPGTGMVVSGGNPGLDAERSKSLTAGFDWSPGFAAGFYLSATYFDVDYTDRIVLPFSSLGLAFVDPDLAPFIVYDPSPEEQAAIIADSAIFFNNSGAPYDPADVVGVAFASFVNASAQAFRGVDMSISYDFNLLNGNVDIFADASWLDFAQQTLPTQDLMTRSGLIFYPARWRARGGATFQTGRLTSTAAVNFVSSGTDNFTSPPAQISSWTTLDLNLRYQLPDWSDRVKGLEVALSVTNALDADPPFAAGGAAVTPGLFFDGTNASPVGRFVAATLRQTF